MRLYSASVALAAALGSTLATALHAQVSSQLRREQDPCACRNFRNTYTAQLFEQPWARCGQGHELAQPLAVGSTLSALLARVDYCMKFYELLDSNACVNLRHNNEPGRWDSGQWCYVSSQCRSASPANGTWAIFVKLCKEGEDEMLREKTPDELFQFWKAQKMPLSLGFLAKMAYPVETAVTVDMTKAFYGMPDTADIKLYQSESAALARLQDSGKPVVIDAKKPPYGLLHGQRFYLLHESSWTCAAGCTE